MYVSARADYALRALVMLAVADEPMTVAQLAEAGAVPEHYLRVVLSKLARAGIVANPRGRAGGYRLTRDAACISAADAVRAVDGILAELPGTRVAATTDRDPGPLSALWLTVQSSIEAALEAITIADLAGGRSAQPCSSLDQRGTRSAGSARVQ